MLFYGSCHMDEGAARPWERTLTFNNRASTGPPGLFSLERRAPQGAIRAWIGAWQPCAAPQGIHKRWHIDSPCLCTALSVKAWRAWRVGFFFFNILLTKTSNLTAIRFVAFGSVSTRGNPCCSPGYCLSLFHFFFLSITYCKVTWRKMHINRFVSRIQIIKNPVFYLYAPLLWQFLENKVRLQRI